MVHGGIRYLQHSDLVRARASCAERSAFLRTAPHLVKPLPIAIPTYGHGRRGKALLRAGIIVRPVAGYGLPEYLRVTLGTAEQNDRFISAWQRILVASAR